MLGGILRRFFFFCAERLVSQPVLYGSTPKIEKRFQRDFLLLVHHREGGLALPCVFRRGVDFPFVTLTTNTGSTELRMLVLVAVSEKCLVDAE